MYKNFPFLSNLVLNYLGNRHFETVCWIRLVILLKSFFTLLGNIPSFN